MQVTRSFALLLLCACGALGRQSAECARWVACADALPGAVKGSMDAAFGPNGNCWQNMATMAQQCTQQCKDALAAQGAMPNAPAECR